MGDDRHPGLASGAPLLRLLALAAGAIAGLALPPLGLPPLLWPALAVLWGLAGDPPAGAMAGGRHGGLRGLGLLWGLAAVLVSHRWLLWLHPLDWVGVPAPLSLPLCLLVWGFCGLAAGLLVEAWLALVRRGDPLRPSTALAGACLWGLVEVLLARGPLFWIGLGSSALPADPALAGLAAYGGAGLVAAVQVLLGWCLWRTLRAPAARRGWLLLTLLLLLVSHLSGWAALAGVVAELDQAGARPGAFGPGTAAAAAPAGLPPTPAIPAPPASQPSAVRLLVLQPAIPTRQKFEAGQQRRLLALLAGAERDSALVPQQQGSESLLLPEGSLAAGQPLPEAAPLEVLSGGFRQEGDQLRSSLLRFAPGSRDPVAWVDKHRLVPLGEWVPLAGLWRWSGLSAVGGLGPGAPSRLLPRPAGAIGVAICYEIADGAALARASREGAQWLLASANLDPYPLLLQHQFQALAQLRAIETGRWLVSAANTGPSLVVDAAGRLQAQLPAGQAASGVVTLLPRSGLSPYVRWREGPLLLLLALALAGRWAPRPGPAPLRSRRPPDKRH
jgi:apolipoprotein N-acyltransferase